MCAFIHFIIVTCVFSGSDAVFPAGDAEHVFCSQQATDINRNSREYQCFVTDSSDIIVIIVIIVIGKGLQINEFVLKMDFVVAFLISCDSSSTNSVPAMSSKFYEAAQCTILKTS